MDAIILNTWLLVGANTIGVLVLMQFKELKESVIETRKKLDSHVENYHLHRTDSNASD